jgi:hypothetical protein
VSESRVVVGSVSAVILRLRVRARARARLVMVMMKMAMMGQLFLLTCIERAVFNGEAAVVVVVVVGHDDGCERRGFGPCFKRGARSSASPHSLNCSPCWTD